MKNQAPRARHWMVGALGVVVGLMLLVWPAAPVAAADPAPVGSNLSCESYYEGAVALTSGPRTFRIACYARPGTQAALMSRVATDALAWSGNSTIYVYRPDNNTVSSLPCATGSTVGVTNHGRLLDASSAQIAAATGDYGDNYFEAIVTCAYTGTLSAREIMMITPPWPTAEGSFSSATGTYWGLNRCELIRPSGPTTYDPWLCSVAAPTDLTTIAFNLAHYGSVPVGPDPPPDPVTVDDGEGCTSSADIGLNPLSWVPALATVLRCSFTAIMVPDDEALQSIGDRLATIQEQPPVSWAIEGTQLLLGIDVTFVHWSDGGPACIDVIESEICPRTFGSAVSDSPSLSGVVYSGWLLIIFGLYSWLAITIIRWF